MADNAIRDQNRVTGILLKGNDGTGPWSWWVDPSTHRALVNATLTGVSITTPSAVVNGKKTVTSAGTAVALATTAAISAVVVQALSGNIGLVYVGSSSVSAANGFELQPGQATGIAIDDISKVYVDAANSSDGVVFIGG